MKILILDFCSFLCDCVGRLIV